MNKKEVEAKNLSSKQELNKELDTQPEVIIVYKLGNISSYEIRLVTKRTAGKLIDRYIYFSNFSFVSKTKQDFEIILKACTKIMAVNVSELKIF